MGYSKQPKWADNYILRICNEYNVPIPLIIWKKTKSFYSSGTAYSHNLIIKVGKDKRDKKLVLIHELAHWIVRRRINKRGHAREFWEILWDLYSDPRNKVTLKYARSREFEYKAAAIKTYKTRKSFKNIYKDNSPSMRFEVLTHVVKPKCEFCLWRAKFKYYSKRNNCFICLKHYHLIKNDQKIMHQTRLKLVRIEDKHLQVDESLV